MLISKSEWWKQEEKKISGKEENSSLGNPVSYDSKCNLKLYYLILLLQWNASFFLNEQKKN